MDTSLTTMTLDELKAKLLSSTDSSELNDLIQLFNLNLKKKEIIRADVLSGLQDKLAEQIGKRVEKNSDTFSNKDLLDYLNTIQTILNKQQKDMDNFPATIAIQNNFVIQDSSQELDKDSRDKVMDLVKNILKQQPVQDDIIDEKSNEEQGEQKSV